MLPAGDRSACRQHSKQKIPAVRVRAFWRYVRIGQLRRRLIVHLFLSIPSTLSGSSSDVVITLEFDATNLPNDCSETAKLLTAVFFDICSLSLHIRIIIAPLENSLDQN